MIRERIINRRRGDYEDTEMPLGEGLTELMCYLNTNFERYSVRAIFLKDQTVIQLKSSRPKSEDIEFIGDSHFMEPVVRFLGCLLFALGVSWDDDPEPQNAIVYHSDENSFRNLPWKIIPEAFLCAALVCFTQMTDDEVERALPGVTYERLEALVQILGTAQEVSLAHGSTQQLGKSPAAIFA